MKNNKKITILLPSLSGGGAEKMNLHLANQLVLLGYKVDIILIKKHGDYLHTVDKKINIVNFWVPVKKKYRTLFNFFPIIIYILKERPFVIISSLTRCNLLASFIKIFVGDLTRIVVVERSHFSSSKKSRKGWKEHYAIPYLIKKLYPKVDTIVAVSKGVAVDLAEICHISLNSVQVIYNPVITPEIKKLSLEFSDHEWLHNKICPVILGVGRLTIQKNFDLLIYSFNELLKKGIHAKLIILGEGNQRKKLETLIKTLNIEDNVSMPGFMQNPYAYMRQSDVFVFSSNWEGFGNVLVESLMCGTPVVSTDCLSGPSEILQDGEYGLLVPMGSIEDMTNAIEKQLFTKVDTDRLIKRSEEYTVQLICNQYLNAILSI